MEYSRLDTHLWEQQVTETPIREYRRRSESPRTLIRLLEAALWNSLEEQAIKTITKHQKQINTLKRERLRQVVWKQ